MAEWNGTIFVPNYRRDTYLLSSRSLSLSFTPLGDDDGDFLARQ